MIESGGTERWRRAVQAFPSVQSNVMVIAAGGEKRSLVAHALHEFKAEHVPVKTDGAFKVGNFQVHMPHAYLGINRLGRLFFRRHADYPAVCCAPANRF